MLSQCVIPKCVVWVLIQLYSESNRHAIIQHVLLPAPYIYRGGTNTRLFNVPSAVKFGIGNHRTCKDIMKYIVKLQIFETPLPLLGSAKHFFF